MLLRNRNITFSSMPMLEAARELQTDSAIRLLDVRSDTEYQAGHIPGSLHLPLQELSQIGELVPDKDTRLFVYCLSGARSARACAQLADFGYSNVINIGGIADWFGPIEH